MNARETDPLLSLKTERRAALGPGSSIEDIARYLSLYDSAQRPHELLKLYRHIFGRQRSRKGRGGVLVTGSS